MPEIASALAPFLLLFFLLHGAYVVVSFGLHYADAAGRSAALSPASYLRHAAVEWWYSLAAVLLYPFGLVPRVRGLSYDPRGGPPIFLVPGFLMNRSCTYALYWRMRRLGYRNLYPVDLLPLLGSIEELGVGLSAQIRYVSRLAGGEPVTCVAHSMGGVVLRWCVEADPELPVAKIITVGSPHQGSRAAHLSPGANAAQLRPGCAFLSGLPQCPRVPVVSLFSRLDNLVIPSDSADFGTRRLEIAGLSHVSLLFSARSFASIAAELPDPYPATTAAAQGVG